ncbi:MAG: hypothetical protein JWL69_3237 [Phycisphaerales bacterium]|nr:hypothetical protein [Phycisphaerales bacterium]
MKTPVQIFDEWVDSTVGSNDELPPRFHPIPPELLEPFDDQRRVFRRRLDATRPMFLPGREIEIYLDFLDDGTCNAAADLYGGMGFVGIHKGAIMLPLEMFHRMFSHPLVLPSIGNSRAERIGPQHSEGMPTDYDDLRELREKAGRSPLPKGAIDPTRRAVAQVCIDLAWGFVAIHELVHIFHGHVEYLYKSRGIPYLLEVFQATSGFSPQLSQDALDFQTLELWADGKAFSVILRGFLTESPDPFLQTIFPKPEGRLFVWSFAMSVLFRIWGMKIDPASLGNTHPPTLIRLEMALLSVSDEVLSLFPELTEERFWDVIKAGQQEAERGIVYSGGDPLLPSDISGARDPRVISHVDQLVDHFENVLLHELKKSAYLKMH